MNDLVALAYVSTAVDLPTDADLEALLLSARERNERLDVTGALLVHDGTFFQILEGPAAAVDEVWRHIREARGHRGIITLMHRPVERRHFEAWQMGFAKAPRSTLLRLQQASWVASLAHSADDSVGMSLLLEFWHNARRR
jgi:hypothetical protein